MEHEFAPEKSAKRSHKPVAPKAQSPQPGRALADPIAPMQMPDLINLNTVQAEWVLAQLEATTTGPLELTAYLSTNPAQPQPFSQEQTITSQSINSGVSVSGGDISVDVENSATTETWLPTLAEELDLGQQIAGLAGALMGQNGGSTTGCYVSKKGYLLTVTQAPQGPLPPGGITIVAAPDPNLTSQPGSFVMPALEGMPSTQAYYILQHLMALAGGDPTCVVLTGPGSLGPDNVVFSQFPLEGNIVEAGGDVSLTINQQSTGPLSLPDITGRPLAMGVAAHAMSLYAAGIPAPISIQYSGGEPITPVGSLPTSVQKTQQSIVIQVQDPSR